MTTQRQQPTPAQRRVLEAMAKGYNLFSNDGGRAWIENAVAWRSVHRGTFASLLRHGWIRSDHPFGLNWQITPAGRAALSGSEATP